MRNNQTIVRGLLLCAAVIISAQTLTAQLLSDKTTSPHSKTLGCSVETTIDVALCYGESYAGYTVAGVYLDHFTSVLGCDSARTLNLAINGTKTNSIKAVICTGGNFDGYTEAGVYTDHFRTPGGCDSVRTLILNVLAPPKPDLGKDFVLCSGSRADITPGIFDSYRWQNGDSTSSFTVLRPDTYSVEVTNGCGSARGSVKVGYSKCKVVFPTAFTPNGDGLNERFRALHTENVDGFSLSVYSRYGGLVFQTSDVNGSWDGKLNGKYVSSSFYVWVCHYQEGGQWVNEKGSVVLIR